MSLFIAPIVPKPYSSILAMVGSISLVLLAITYKVRVFWNRDFINEFAYKQTKHHEHDENLRAAILPFSKKVKIDVKHSYETYLNRELKPAKATLKLGALLSSLTSTLILIGHLTSIFAMEHVSHAQTANLIALFFVTSVIAYVFFMELMMKSASLIAIEDIIRILKEQIDCSDNLIE